MLSYCEEIIREKVKGTWKPGCWEGHPGESGCQMMAEFGLVDCRP